MSTCFFFPSFFPSLCFFPALSFPFAQLSCFSLSVLPLECPWAPSFQRLIYHINRCIIIVFGPALVLYTWECLVPWFFIGIMFIFQPLSSILFLFLFFPRFPLPKRSGCPGHRISGRPLSFFVLSPLPSQFLRVYIPGF